MTTHDARRLAFTIERLIREVILDHNTRDNSERVQMLREELTALLARKETTS